MLAFILGFTHCQRQYSPIEILSEDFHQAQDQLTSVMVHDIFSPPLASRVYAYANLAAYEILAQEKDNPHGTLKGVLRDFKGVSLANDSLVNPKLAALIAYLEVGKSLIFSVNRMAEYMDGLYQGWKEQNPNMYASSHAYALQVVGEVKAWYDQDLFVGGRILPNEYPYAPNSYLLENNGKGVFKDVTENRAKGLKNIGMVSDALWTDYNGDKQMDLMLVGEWMPITLFLNQNGSFKNISEELGFKDTDGWWNSIAQADFDRDGDMDYVAGNFGLNSQLKTSLEHPISIYAKDYDKNGSVDPILSCYDEGKNYPLFSKDDIQQQLTILKNRFVRYSEYADLTIDQVFTPEELKGSKVLYAKTFETSFIENLGNGQFKITALPKETQFSPIYGLTTGDFNQDGKPDIIMGGNFTASRVKFGHYDAIKGICLLGDGSGGFTYLDASESGLMVGGEVRDIQKITTANGEEHLIFSRNNNSPKIYKNNLN